MTRYILNALKAEHDKLNAVIADARHKQNALKTAAAIIAGDAKASLLRQRRKYPAADVAAIQMSLDEGATVNEAAARHDISSGLIYKWIDEGKIKRQLQTRRERVAVAGAAAAAKHASAGDA